MSSLRAICCLLLALTLTASAAPVDKASADSSTVNEVQKEEELQSLLQLADEESGRSDVTVHEEHNQHVHEVNGKKMEVDTARKTVSDTKTGQVISDVKQEVSKSDDAAQPEVEVKTEVDVPAEGVHETIVQSGEEAEKEVENAEAEAEAEAEEEIEFSPEAVAEYLYQTGDFNRFYAALAQLVNASVMTETEAQAYSQMVALEYERMQMEDFENSILVQRRASPSLLDQYSLEPPADFYPLPMEASLGEQEEAAASEGYPLPMSLDSPEDLYALERGGPSLVPARPVELVGEEEEEEEIDPYELLYSLWNEAYGTGDVRAEELVSELFDKVRDDNDPDDEGQVRDILLDLIASSQTGGEQEEEEEEEMIPQQPQDSLYGWQPIMDVEPVQALPMQPMGNALPSAAAAAEEEEEVQPLAEDEEAANELMLENAQKRTAEEPTLNKDSKLQAEQQQPTASDDDDEEEEEEKESNANDSSSNSNNSQAQTEEESSENQDGEKAAEGGDKEETAVEKEQAPVPTPAASAQKAAAAHAQ